MKLYNKQSTYRGMAGSEQQLLHLIQTSSWQRNKKIIALEGDLGLSIVQINHLPSLLLFQ